MNVHRVPFGLITTLLLCLAARVAFGQTSDPAHASQTSTGRESRIVNRGALLHSAPRPAYTADDPRQLLAPIGPARLDSNPAGKEPIPLAPRRRDSQSLQQPRVLSPQGTLTTIVSSLAIVLGLFFIVIWSAKRVKRGGGSDMLPKDVVQTLGWAPLNQRQQMVVVRLGSKLVLLSVTPSGAEPLAEINDQEEVQRLTALCQQSQPGSISASFRQVLEQLGNEPAHRHALGDERPGARGGTRAATSRTFLET